MAKADALIAMATKDYGADTGNTASTYYEVRTWNEQYKPAGKPLIPLRMVRLPARVSVGVRITETLRCSQIPWTDEFEHETARELFGSNLLALTWLKGETMPDDLIDDILRALGLERETDKQRKTRVGCLVDESPPAAPDCAPHCDERKFSTGVMLEKGKVWLNDAGRRVSEEATNLLARLGRRRSSQFEILRNTSESTQELIQLLQRPEVFNKM